MYLSFFGLNEKPFAITPDPRYLFLSERHGEGLAHLIYGVTESGGFIQLTGEVGTGKTTLVRTLLGQLPAEVDVALVLNPQLSALEFLCAICEELGVEMPADTSSSKALVDALNRHLLAAHARGRRTILLVDEAQNLSSAVLEQVRLLTNLETARQKLLQIILIGQPELRELLGRVELRQLAQRVTGRYHLEPLTRDETLAYIDHRLRVAGALREIFQPAAKRSVYRLSGGIPRLVNVICDRALLGAYSRESREVTPAIVRRAAREVEGEDAPRRGWLWPAGSFAVAVAAAAVAWWQFAPQAPADVNLPLAGVAQADAAGSEPEPAAAPATMPPADAEAGTAVATDAADTANDDEPPPPALPDLLASRPTSPTGAVARLLALWGAPAPPGSGCQQAADAAGLACLVQRGTWPVLRQLDRPAMLTLIDADGGRHYPVLTALDEREAELLIGDERFRLPLAEVGEFWFGDYLLVWRPPTGRVESLRPGSQGEGVRWLQQSLAALDGSPAPGADQPAVFDAALEERLRAFQRRNRLQVDGLAGQQTQILINSLLAAENAPRLSDAAQ